jgi:viroplasmin and RNaseH domain-containing protein
MAWYVVFRGRVLGVYASWAICSDQVLGFSGASFRSYATRNEAKTAYATYLHHEKKAQGRSCRNLELEGCTDISSVSTYFSFVLQIDVIGLWCWTCNTDFRLRILI